MKNNKRMTLAIALLMFPQVAQTLYSPALADFKQAFSVSPEMAAQTLTVYFLAFAFGVVVWGRACDQMGRRASMLCGLGLFAASSAAAVFVNTFQGLLITQGCAAFGAAVGSVVTQTCAIDSVALN
jgi:MFS family permease